MLDVDSRSQPYEVSTLNAAGVLEHVRDTETKKRIADRSILRLALQYCRVHRVADVEEAATWGDHERGSAFECDVRLGNAGTPMVRAGVAPAFGAALGVSTVSAMGLLSNALDLEHRFPLLHAQVEELRLPLWKARRVAEFTYNLSVEACGFIDSELAARAQGFGMVTLERKIAMAIALFHPELLPDAEDVAKAGWDVKLDRPQAGESAGTSEIRATGDTLGFARFYELVSTVATALGKLGDTDTFEQRKAKAVGIIGDPDELLALLERAENLSEDPPADQPTDPKTRTGSETSPGSGSSSGRRRPRSARVAGGLRKPAKVNLNLHLNAADLANLDAETGEHHVVGEVEKLGPITLARIREWLTTSGASITPVINRPIDLNRTEARDSHDPPGWMREQVILRDRHCVFPWCERDARSCDLDHIEPYDHGDEGGPAPPGQTRPDGLACLCRTHHRCKTLYGWSYQRLPDGSYRWKDPHGHIYIVDPETGTTDLG
jgi:hypothetical protein